MAHTSPPKPVGERSSSHLGLQDLASDDLYELLHDVTPLLQGLMEDEAQVPVGQPLAPEELPDVFRTPSGLPLEARPWKDVLADLRTLAELSPRTTTRHFFNQLFGGRLGSAVVGDILSSFLNQSMYTYKVAGPQVLIEQQLIERMGALMGFATPSGTFTPGGSLSNLIGMVLARDAAFPEAREEGLGMRCPVIYTSTEAHYSIRKNAGVLGFGRKQVVEIPVDRSGRMSAVALEQAVARDRALGRTPWLVVATAGTTVRGAFDPLASLASIAESEGLWLHVDAAFGGSLVLSQESRAFFEGSERADSITWDAHKLLGVPLTSSVLLVRQPGLLERSLSEQADYLFQGELGYDLDPGQRSLQCGRRNDALKVWAAWQRHGERGLGARLDRCLGLAHRLAELIDAHPELDLVEWPPSVNVCFERPGADPDEVVAALHRAGDAMVGTARVGGRKVIRWAGVNPGIGEDELTHFVRSVVLHARSVAV